MAKYKIVGVSVDEMSIRNVPVFKGFYLSENKDGYELHVPGVVDPFLDAKFGGVTEMDVITFPVEMPMYTAEWWKLVIEWANTMVGKYIVCDHLVYKAFATSGNTRFSDT